MAAAQALQAQRDRRPTDLDEQYGKPPPTETPQFATSNVIFNVASVFALLLLGFLVVDVGSARLEVYKEKMQDLLRPNSEMLRVKELPQRGLFVDGLSREYVTCASDVMAVIRAGLRTRAVGRTRCNNYSSRSHVVFVLHVEQQSLHGEERLGKLTLVDLAGSEKVSKNECVGETFEEAKKINWSLSALGKVIDALAEQRSHVPYRDSKLTRVLQEVPDYILSPVTSQSFKQVAIAEQELCPRRRTLKGSWFLMLAGETMSSSTGNMATLSAAGCDVADVLADLRRQREATKSKEERRLFLYLARCSPLAAGAPDRTMQRVDKIAQSYTRLHPEVYILNAPAFLDPRFLKVVQELRVSGPAAASIAGLKSEGLLEELRPGIWSFPVFTTAFCDAFESELGHFRASGLPRSAPNTMNRHGVIMSELGFEELLDPLVFEYVNVLASRLLPAFTEFLDSYRGFTVPPGMQKF
ncbi:kif5 [Symbiodinium sp. CCMP2456]|nr:kif5 [Symbiodinium sp. CCMP2456]